MKEKNQPHWIIAEITEEEAPRNTIDLWPRIQARASSLAVKARKPIIGVQKRQLVFGLMLILVLISSLAFVPGVRAFAKDIIQRMGIAFVDTKQFDTNVMKVEKAEKVTPPPSLSVEEIREQIAFPLMLPTWLPDGLNYVYRSIREYDPQSWQGSGKQLSIIYANTPDQDFTNGLLYLHANDGPIGAPPLLAESREQYVTVNGQPGIYVHGGWQDDGRGDPNMKMGILQWDDNADDAYLTWTQGGVTYLLEAHNLRLNMDDLLRIASSMSGE
jgi:hypothetical protein